MSKNVKWRDLQNGEWSIVQCDSGGVASEWAQLSVLQDIRAYLARLAKVLECSNTIDIPNILRRIDSNTQPRPRRRRKATK